MMQMLACQITRKGARSKNTRSYRAEGQRSSRRRLYEPKADKARAVFQKWVPEKEA